MSRLAALKRPLVAGVALVALTVTAVALPLVSNWSSWFAGSWDWSSAKTHAADLDEGGFTDWRLPTRADVQAALDSSTLPNIDHSHGSMLIWTSETRGNKAWTVRIYTDENGVIDYAASGAEELALKTSYLHTIAVR